VHLKVADLERAVRFYRDVLRFHEQGRVGTRAAFLSAGDSLDLALNSWQSEGGDQPSAEATGLYSFGVRYRTRSELASVVRHVLACDVAVLRASDHGVCQSVYIEDPDGNGVELYWEHPRATWPLTIDGRLAVIDIPLDLDSLLQVS